MQRMKKIKRIHRVGFLTRFALSLAFSGCGGATYNGCPEVIRHQRSQKDWSETHLVVPPFRNIDNSRFMTSDDASPLKLWQFHRYIRVGKRTTEVF